MVERKDLGVEGEEEAGAEGTGALFYLTGEEGEEEGGGCKGGGGAR